ncbi:hypothetical protein [Sphingomonas sanxanigenens]|uniref:hypothetical protein n=1 Tax=Sphingomonas sanxanigenens TaxID=397260 RepID=UPI00138F00D4|nr:hypothetical protein [Sphingomonas sanxanigenens]
MLDFNKNSVALLARRFKEQPLYGSTDARLYDVRCACGVGGSPVRAAESTDNTLTDGEPSAATGANEGELSCDCRAGLFVRSRLDDDEDLRVNRIHRLTLRAAISTMLANQ